MLAVVVLAAAGAGGYLVLFDPVPASSPTVALLPSSSPTAEPSATPSASPNASSTSSPSPSSPRPSQSPTVARAAWPTPATTGVPAGTKLASSGTCTLRSGTYVGRRWTCRVTVAGTVTIRNSELLQGVQVASGRLVVEDSTLGPESGCGGSNLPVLASANYTARRVEVRNSSEGARSEGPNILIEDSFFGMCELPDPAHGDAFQGCINPCDNAGPNVNNRFVHNTVDMPDGSAREGITAPIFWSDDSASGLVITDNLIAGGGMAIRIHSGSKHTVTGNRIVTGSYRWEPADCRGAGSMNWADNRLVTIRKDYGIASTGAAVSCPG